MSTPAWWFAVLWRRRWAIGLSAAVVAGIIFRLIWLSDMEYKADEIWTLSHVEAFWRGHGLPLVGMPASGKWLPHPGLSIWIFAGISAFLPSVDPLSLTRAVQVVNVIAILLLTFFAWAGVEQTEREPWLWSAALVCVNPLAVLFSRKIWAQDILPVFTMGMLIAWWYRSRWWGAFAWGFVGALLGQIHLGGFFFAAAFLAVTLLFDRRAVRWPAWLLGSVLGALPMLPWLAIITQTHADIVGAALHDFIPRYFLQWFNFADGLGLQYALGRDFLPFLASPRIGTWHTYLAGAFFAVAAVSFAAILIRFLVRLRADPAHTARLVFSPRSSTALALAAAFLGCGMIFTLVAVPVYLHYLIITFSLPALSIAWLDRAGSSGNGTMANSRGLLSTLVVAQALVTALFLSYIHETQFIAGDYGTPYRSQAHQGAP